MSDTLSLVQSPWLIDHSLWGKEGETYSCCFDKLARCQPAFSTFAET